MGATDPVPPNSPVTWPHLYEILHNAIVDAIPRRAVENKTRPPEESYLEKAIGKYSFKAKNETEKAFILQHYRKFMMYRNPVERLISGFLSKIDRLPLIGLKASKPERNWLRLAIYRYTHPEEFKLWKASGANVPIQIGFPDFIRYWIKTKGIPTDEHFRQIYRLCTPCENRYTYYGNFNNFKDEVVVFNEMIRGNISDLLEVTEEKQGRVANTALKFYSQISFYEKIAIINILAWDLGFYYTLFPAEKDSHKAIMGMDYDVSIPFV